MVPWKADPIEDPNDAPDAPVHYPYYYDSEDDGWIRVRRRRPRRRNDSVSAIEASDDFRRWLRE